MKVRRWSVRQVAKTKQRLVRRTDLVLDRLEGLATTPAPVSARVRLTCVFLQWDPERARVEFDHLVERLRAFPELESTVVLVDNRSAGGSVSIDDNATIVVDGDNSAYEFSGLQAGIDAARRRGIRTDVWLLANDRFRAGNRPFLGYFTPAAVQTALALPSIIGQIDAYPRTVWSYGFPIRRWITTSFFFMSDDVLDRCCPLVTVTADEIAAGFGDGDERTLRADGPIGADHAAYLLAWLTGAEGTEITTRWYGWSPEGSFEPAVLRRKLQSILNEQLLSARAIAAGVALVPMQVAHRLATLGLDRPAIRREGRRILSDPEHGGIQASNRLRLRLALHLLCRSKGRRST